MKKKKFCKDCAYWQGKSNKAAYKHISKKGQCHRKWPFKIKVIRRKAGIFFYCWFEPKPPIRANSEACPYFYRKIEFKNISEYQSWVFDENGNYIQPYNRNPPADMPYAEYKDFTVRVINCSIFSDRYIDVYNPSVERIHYDTVKDTWVE